MQVTNQAVVVRGLTAMCLSFTILAGAVHPARARAAADTSLSGLTFASSGTVRREMRFQFFDQPCFYMERPDRWGTEWGKFPNVFPYLYQVSVADGGGWPRPTRRWACAPRCRWAGWGPARSSCALTAVSATGTFSTTRRRRAVCAEGAARRRLVRPARAVPKARRRAPGRLRTHPPAGLPAIEQIQYSGLFPVSRLRFSDPLLPLTVDLYAYCEFHTGDAKASATPAVIFTFNLRNPSEQAGRGRSHVQSAELHRRTAFRQEGIAAGVAGQGADQWHDGRARGRRSARELRRGRVCPSYGSSSPPRAGSPRRASSPGRRRWPRQFRSSPANRKA